MSVTIRYMSWNIQHLGPKKRYAQGNSQLGKHPNWDALATMIAAVTKLGNVNLLAILELTNSTAGTIAGELQQLLDKAFKTTSGNQWNYLWLPTNKTGDQDVYALFYRSGQGFSIVLDNSNNPIMGCHDFSAQTDNYGNYKRLDFHSRNATRGGRAPSFFLFETTGFNKLRFTVVSYHAMFASLTQYNAVGLQNAPKLQPITKVLWKNTIYSVDKTILSGDFNWDYMTDTHAYKNARGLGSEATSPNAHGDAAKSSLVKNSWNFSNWVDARASAYDNIFTNAGMTNGGHFIVPVLLNMSKGKPLAGDSANFNHKYITAGNLIAANPPILPEDAWHIYREAISDHLPVFAEINI